MAKLTLRKNIPLYPAFAVKKRQRKVHFFASPVHGNFQSNFCFRRSKIVRCKWKINGIYITAAMPMLETHTLLLAALNFPCFGNSEIAQLQILRSIKIIYKSQLKRFFCSVFDRNASIVISNFYRIPRFVRLHTFSGIPQAQANQCAVPLVQLRQAGQVANPRRHSCCVSCFSRVA